MLTLIIIIPILFGLLISGFYILCFWKLFDKAGEKGWKVLIPILNIITYYKIANAIPFLFISIAGSILFGLFCYQIGDLFLILSFVGLFLIVISYLITQFKLVRSFNKGFVFFLFMLILPVIALPALALGKSEYGVQDMEVQLIKLNKKIANQQVMNNEQELPEDDMVIEDNNNIATKSFGANTEVDNNVEDLIELDDEQPVTENTDDDFIFDE